MTEAAYTISTIQIFILFFITLGPLPLLAPFLAATRPLDDSGVRKIALHAAAIASLILVAGGFLGYFLISNWHVEVPVLTLTAGIVFFLVALRIVLQPYKAPAAPPAVPVPVPSVMQIVFPMIVTPHGLAVLVVLLIQSTDMMRTFTILGLLLFNMLLDLLIMTFSRSIIKTVGPALLQALFGVLGILIMSLSVQIIIVSLRLLKIIPGI